MLFEVGEQGEEDGQRQFEDLRHGGHAILGERDTQVLFDGVYEHLVRAENGTRVLQDGQ